MFTRVLSKREKACPTVDVLSVVNTFDEKYFNCHSAQMMLTKNLLSQEMNCGNLAILVPLSRGVKLKAIQCQLVAAM